MIKHKVRRQQLSIYLSNKSLSKGAIAVIGALLVSCSAAPQTGGARAVPVPISSVESGTVSDSSDYVANLQSRQSVTLQPRVDGYVQEIYVKAGDRVLFGKYSGSEIKLDGEELLIMREDEILGIIARAGAAGGKKGGK